MHGQITLAFSAGDFSRVWVICACGSACSRWLVCELPEGILNVFVAGVASGFDAALSARCRKKGGTVPKQRRRGAFKWVLTEFRGPQIDVLGVNVNERHVRNANWHNHFSPRQTVSYILQKDATWYRLLLLLNVTLPWPHSCLFLLSSVIRFIIFCYHLEGNSLCKTCVRAWSQNPILSLAACSHAHITFITNYRIPRLSLADDYSGRPAH